MELIKLENVSVSYGSCEALHDVNLSIHHDDFLGVIGPNGGGKTTLVKAILGTLPYSGRIVCAPELCSDGHRRIGYLPQQNNFDPAFPISVREVVISGLQARKGIFGRYGREDYRKADELLDTAGIGSVAGSPIGEISGGQQQRALLCRAIISDPRLLILDEPANFVDNKFERELYELLAQLNRRMAIMMVSHDIGTITSVVKNIVCVNRHVHRHDSNVITPEQLDNYDCPIQIVTHGHVPHTVLERH